MVNIYDLFHYLIGLIIVAILIWSIIKTHNYFSKDNIPIELLTNRKSPN
jgi:hypothetical protein